MAKSREPEPLRRGKAFHKLIQEEWHAEADGKVEDERYVRKQNGRRGRTDIFVDDEEPDGTVAIVEVKASDWDRMTDQAVRRNVRRQIRQIRGYIESQLVAGEYTDTGEGKDVCPGIIFPKRPKDRKRMQLIEDMFLEEGIPVVWHDESMEECKARNAEERPSRNGE